MADEQRDAEFQESRSGDGGGDDVVRDRRNAHAEQNAGEHGQHERKKQALVADRDDELAERVGSPGERHGADDHADDRAGDADRQRGLRPFGQRIPAERQRLAATFRQQAPDNQNGHADHDDVDTEFEEGSPGNAQADPEDRPDDSCRKPERDRTAENQQHGERQPDRAGKQGRVAGEQKIDQRPERQQQIPFFLERLQRRWQLVLGQAGKSVFAGFQMDHPEGGGEIEDCRNDRGLDHLVIFDAQCFGHDERDGPHHRRHDLPAHRGRGFHPTRKLRPVTEAFHQGNGKLPGGHDIGDAGPGNRAHQPRGNDRDLGRPALLVTDETERDIGEELDHSGALKE